MFDDSLNLTLSERNTTERNCGDTLGNVRALSIDAKSDPSHLPRWRVSPHSSISLKLDPGHPSPG
jgi:hypothetical protein